MCKPKSGVTETEAPQANPIEIASGKSLIRIILFLINLKDLNTLNFFNNNI